MSAFLCSARHISAVVNSINTHTELHMSGSELFTLLANANAASVDFRYNGTESSLEVSGYRFDPVANVPRISALKQVHCLVYQSCEVPNWEETPACRALRRIEAVITRNLPGYSDAPWGLEDAPHSGAISLFDMASKKAPPRFRKEG